VVSTEAVVVSTEVAAEDTAVSVHSWQSHPMRSICGSAGIILLNIGPMTANLNCRKTPHTTLRLNSIAFSIKDLMVAQVAL
jgi:hypothetical protein